MTLEGLLEHVASGVPVAVYVSTPGCGPCRALRPQVRARFGEGSGWTLIEVDAQTSREIAGQLVVFTVPALVLFVDGREVWRGARFLRAEELDRAVSLAQVATG